VAISTSAESVARRVLELIGVGDDERFSTFEGRVAHRVELDDAVAKWVGERSQADVLAAFDAAQAAIAPVMTMTDISEDEHYQARGSIAELDGVPMQGLVARLSATPGALRWAGRALDEDGEAIRAEVEGDPDR
jgi:crotonobetainyl-CoA:carnitine CoA-transferase CaiB-like acyl-CoA transferase